MTTHEKYAWVTAEEAARQTGENYERYLAPSIGVPSARPVIDAAALEEERCQPFVSGDAVVMKPGLLVATARRS